MTLGMLFIELGECTKIDYSDKVKITDEVSWPCLELCASGSSRVRRPRLYWHKPRVSARPGFFLSEVGEMLWGELAGPLEPCSAWVVPGWRWASEDDDTVRLPTFTRAIPRTRPPPGAPGLHKISGVARARYFRDALRFPPYTYEDHLCFVREADSAFSWQDPGVVRVALASERETLRVG